MEYRRTAVIKLDTPEGADSHLRETIEQFKYCANTASEWCWHGDDGYHVTSKAKAEDALYDQLREDTELTANLVQKGIHQAVEATKNCVERLRNDQNTSRPTFTADTAIYDKRSATFHRDHVSLSTPDGRIECDYVLPENPDTPPTKYVANEDYEFRRATLHRRDGDWYLHTSMRKEDDDTDTTTGHRTVLGVDLGVNQLAVASTGRFWSADEFNHWKREYEKRRGDLQQCGTRAAHDAIAGVERKEDGRFEIFLHRVANEIVAEAVEYDCSHIVFGDLTDIRENVPQASWHHLWAFRRLYEYSNTKPESRASKPSKWTHETPRSGARPVGLPTIIIATARTSSVRIVATRTTPTTTLPRTSACSISGVGKTQTTEAHL